MSIPSDSKTVLAHPLPFDRTGAISRIRQSGITFLVAMSSPIAVRLRSTLTLSTQRGFPKFTQKASHADCSETRLTFPKCLNAAGPLREIGLVRDLDSQHQVASGPRAESPRGMVREPPVVTEPP